MVSAGANEAPACPHAEGLLPVTSRNGDPIYTVKKQNGVDRLFVTFVNGINGLW